MPVFSSLGAIVWPTATFLIVVALGGATILLRKSRDKWLIRLSALACVVALVFAPMLRALPEEMSLPFFLIGLWPTLATIAIVVVASMARFIQRPGKESLPSLLLSALAAGLFYVSLTTPLIWPFRTY